MTAERPQPAYLRARDAIAGLLGGPGYPPGAKIPSERALADQLGLSRMTVRQAVEGLVRSGTLERDGTSGTRVSRPGVVRNLSTLAAQSMTEMVRQAGARPGTRLLHFGALRADGTLARSLMVPRGAPVLEVRRLRLADGVPFCIECTRIPQSRIPGLVAADLEHDASLYDLLQARYGLLPTRRQGRIRLGSVGPEDAALLGVAPGSGVLEYGSTVFDGDGRPIEAVVSLNHPQLVVFTVEDASTRFGPAPAAGSTRGAASRRAGLRGSEGG